MKTRAKKKRNRAKARGYLDVVSSEEYRVIDLLAGQLLLAELAGTLERAIRLPKKDRLWILKWLMRRKDDLDRAATTKRGRKRGDGNAHSIRDAAAEALVAMKGKRRTEHARIVHRHAAYFKIDEGKLKRAVTVLRKEWLGDMRTLGIDEIDARQLTRVEHQSLLRKRFADELETTVPDSIDMDDDAAVAEFLRQMDDARQSTSSFAK